MTFEQIAASFLLGLIGVYLVVRVCTAAFFKSKQQFDHQPRKHDGRPQPR